MATHSREVGDRRATEQGDEATVAGLIDRLELQVSEVARLRTEVDALRAEREQLTAELSTARAWVRELASELEEARSYFGTRPWSLRSRMPRST